MVDGVLSVGLGSRPTLRPVGPVVVPLEACYRTRRRSGQAACYSVPDGHGFFGDDPVGQAGGLVHEVWSAGWLRLAPFSSYISWRAVRDPSSLIAFASSWTFYFVRCYIFILINLFNLFIFLNEFIALFILHFLFNFYVILLYDTIDITSGANA